MDGRGIRRAVSALVALATMGLAALPPLQAQQSTPRPDAQALMASLQAVEHPQGSSVSCARLPGCIIYLLSNSYAATPSFIILRPTAEGGRKQRPAATAAELRQLAERFMRAYKLTCTAVPMEDGSAVCLVRETKPPRKLAPEQQAMQALADEHSLIATIRWLTSRCGNPRRLDGTRLVWRRDIKQGSNHRELELYLNLQGGVPCYVDLRLRQVALAKVDEIVSDSLRLPLEPVSGDTGSVLRRRLGLKPLGYVAEKAKGNPRGDGICLIRPGGENGYYRLATTSTLQQLRERGNRNPAPDLPELVEATWPDEGKGTAAASAAAPARPAAQPAPQPASQPAPKPASPAAAAAGEPAPAMPGPAEARRAYSERLKAL